MPKTQKIKTVDMKEYRKQYYKKHPEKFSSPPQFCEVCKCTIKSQFERHEKTKKHQNLINC